MAGTGGEIHQQFNPTQAPVQPQQQLAADRERDAHSSSGSSQEGKVSETPTLAAHAHNGVDSSDNEKGAHTAVDMEDEKQPVQRSQTGVTARSQGVDVERSTGMWNSMKKGMGPLSLLKTRQADEERMGEEREDSFDLEEILRGTLQRRDEAGLKRKMLGVVFEDLKVIGAGGIKLPIRTFPNAVMEFFLWPVIWTMMKVPGSPLYPKPKDLLVKFDGAARGGEMVLVLGRPGSGCSTFLKAIGNQHVAFLGVEGTISYGGLNPAQVKKQYTGEVIYCEEDDQHNATLTVDQTVGFALSTKTPAKATRIGWTNDADAKKTSTGEHQKASKADYRDQVKNTILRMLNIDHTRNTVVGNAFVRGVSGGERKRVSIAEMMVAGASVNCWDNSTRGLDAATATDLGKSLRLLTNLFHATTFVSLYQAGEEIYQQFDKVLVIDKGRQVYYGPASQARQYFIDQGFRDLPRQTTADYLTGCTDENERQFADGRSAEDVSSTPEKLEEAYRASAIYEKEMAAKDEYKAFLAAENPHLAEFQEAVRAEKRKTVGKKSPFTVGFTSQTWALTKRSFVIRLQDKLGISVAFITSIIIAILAGTIFLDLPKTAAGGFTRGSILFLAILFNSFQAFNELPTQMMGRPIMWRQAKNFAFYRPSALSIASTLADIPIQSIQILIFGMIIYLLCGLVRNAGAFFTFYALIYAGFLALSGFFRLLGCLCSSYDVAARMAAAIVILMVLYSGYIVPVFNQKRWLFWLYYCNPLQWGFSGLMANEFGRIDLDCVGTYITPYNVGSITKYPTTLGENQVCTLQGATPGNPVVPGRDYIQAAFRFSYTQAWPHFGYLIAYFVLFQFLSCLCMEYLKHGAGMPEIVVFLPEDKKRKTLNAALAEKREKARAGEEQQDLSALVESRKPFTWSNLTYDVPVAGGQRRLLDDVFGYVKPGTLTALMGASGAGKTTLLDVLAQRKNIGVIQGDILIDGKPIGPDFQRGTAYAEQLDVHEPTATVREALRFSAYLRQPAAVSREEKDAYVEEVIQLLEMEDIADAMVGWPVFGLSVEARKRLTIGVELAAKPELLLFLDEPTSGLDGQSAYNLVRFLKKLANAGQAILCTIHQPNALLFENFDRLLLLKKGGRTVYFGPIGKDSKDIRAYFKENGAECPPDANMAEKMLDYIGAGTQKRVGDKDWADRYLESKLFEENKREIAAINAQAQAHPQETKLLDSNTYASPFLAQVSFVTKRTFVSFWRSPDYCFTRLFNHAIVALLTSLTFLNVGNSVADLQYRVFAIFIASVLPAIIITQVEPQYIMARDVFVRENSSRMYSGAVFALAQLAGETPYSVLCTVVYFLLFYYPIGFNTASNRAGYHFFMLLVVEMFSVTLGQAVAALSPTIFIAVSTNPFLLLIFALFCGVTIPKAAMPAFWRAWMYELDPFTRMISGLLSNELQGLRIECKPEEFIRFRPPGGQDCQTWAGEFVSAVGGYLDNPGATDTCAYCQYREGNDFLRPLDISFSTRWRDLGIFIAFTAFNIIVTLVAATLFKFNKR